MSANDTPQPFPVNTRLGELPPLWRHSALFFGDLYAIFYGEPEKTRQLQESVAGFFGYGGRLIPIMDLLYGGGNNVLILHEHADTAGLDYFRERLGLSLPTMELLDHNEYDSFHEALGARQELFEFLRAHPARCIDGYVTDPYLERIARRLEKPVVNSYQESKNANDKIALNHFLGQAGLPVFHGGEVAPDDLDECLAGLAKEGYTKAVVRSSLGASGFGMATVELDGSPVDLPYHLQAEKCLLVQGWIKPGVLGITHVTSPSVQFFIDDKRATLFDLTGQLLKDASIHEGNVAPPVDLPGDAGVQEEILAQSREVAAWVAATGYRGTGSIDYLVYEQNGTVEVNVCEVNARVTGATYPSFLARHFLPGQAWLMRNFRFDSHMTCEEIINALDQAGSLYLPGKSDGVLPINFIRDNQGRVVKCQLLFLNATPEACINMIKPTLSALPMPGRHDRD